MLPGPRCGGVFLAQVDDDLALFGAGKLQDRLAGAQRCARLLVNCRYHAVPRCLQRGERAHIGGADLRGLGLFQPRIGGDKRALCIIQPGLRADPARHQLPRPVARIAGRVALGFGHGDAGVGGAQVGIELFGVELGEHLVTGNDIATLDRTCRDGSAHREAEVDLDLGRNRADEADRQLARSCDDLGHDRARRGIDRRRAYLGRDRRGKCKQKDGQAHHSIHPAARTTRPG